MSRATMARRSLWVLLALPGVAQLALLLYAMLARLGYPYDLEWMEGGLLAHAYRITHGLGGYVEPSIDFIPYLYTPLYPGLLAAMSPLFGLSYAVGRAVSVAAALGILALATVAIYREAERRDRSAALCGVAVAAGVMAATYPWVEAWYDLVRADTLFVCMALGGLLGVRAWAHAGEGIAGHARIASAAALLALSFFCKQTGVLFVATGGLLLLFLNWRRLPVYVAVAGVIGLGGTWLLQRATGGWFWTYIYEVHQVHDFNMERFYRSFDNILFQFPVMTAIILVGLLAVAVAALARRELPRSSGGLLVWSLVFAIAVIMGAVGWGTQWAHFNAYIPAMITGGIAAGSALPALAGAIAALVRGWPTRRRAVVETGIPAVAAAALGAQLLAAWWSPSDFIPTRADREAGDALIEHIRGYEGDVFIPYHPWYAHLADKPLYVHRMGLLDMSYGGSWQIHGVREALAEARFDAVILDNRPVGREFPGLRSGYKLHDHLPREMSPRVYSGADVFPHSIWVAPTPAERPPEARVLFDFETGDFQGWTREGPAWGARPRTRPVPGQGPVRRYGGSYFITSMHGGDESTGTLTSPTFLIDGDRITFWLAGGRDLERLRAELVIDGEAVLAATGNDSERLEKVEWEVSAYRDREAKFRLVDEATGSWGHLNADDFVLWSR
jgi:hypothetical protein